MIQSGGKPGWRMGVWIGNESWDWKKKYGLFDVDLGDSYRECKKWMIGKEREIANGRGCTSTIWLRIQSISTVMNAESVYEFKNKLGEGWVWNRCFRGSGFGEVFVALSKQSNVYVAIKKVKLLSDDKRIETESILLKECQSPFIVRYYDVIRRERELWVRRLLF